MTYALTHNMVEAHEHATQRKAASVANNRAGFVMCADDMTADEFMDAVVEHLQERDDMTEQQYETLGNKIARMGQMRKRGRV